MPHLADQHPGWRPELLRRRRIDLGLTLLVLADQIRNLNPKEVSTRGFTPPLASPEVIGKHERGETYPGADYRTAYCHFFQATESDLGFRHPYPHEIAQSDPPRPAAPSPPFAEDMPSPRVPSYSGLTGARLVPPLTDRPEGRIFMTGADDTFDFIVNAERAAARPEVLDLLNRQVRALTVAFPTEATNLVGPLLDAQKLAFRLLDGPTPPDQARDLYFLAAIACGLLARAGVDLSQVSTAHIYARAAYLCADRAGHPGLRTWIRVEQARAAYWSGAPAEALRYLELADQDAQQVHGTIATEVAVSAARAHAALGNAEAAHTAISRAADARERVERDDLDEMGGDLSTPLAVQLFVAADALALLPDQPTAEQAALQAVEAFAEPEAADVSYGSRAGAHINLGLARIRRGDPEGAREALDSVLSLPPARRNHGIRTLTGRVQSALTDPRYGRSPAALDMAAETEAYRQVTSPIRLPE
jgi:tetratricopeptide (TPR) repeat protein